MASSGVVLARNESGRRFPHAEDAEALRELRAEVIDLLEAGSGTGLGTSTTWKPSPTWRSTIWWSGV